MLFEDLYDSILRRYRVSPPKVEQERQIAPGRLYESLDASRPGSQTQPNKVQEDNGKGENPSK